MLTRVEKEEIQDIINNTIKSFLCNDIFKDTVAKSVHEAVDTAMDDLFTTQNAKIIKLEEDLRKITQENTKLNKKLDDYEHGKELTALLDTGVNISVVEANAFSMLDVSSDNTSHLSLSHVVSTADGMPQTISGVASSELSNEESQKLKPIIDKFAVLVHKSFFPETSYASHYIDTESVRPIKYTVPPIS
ncbi:hypothetical protein ILUMI_03464 [Ignelater luminosus]|uniref:Peptidase A2 domain-containing protein n=1 Tax=Ignelater luminosus TaxID=2038154 RepID=A0A8K0DBH9_IGNLU|nr:hypothetical protein ILUMI_03464 [Ignelater luminosus]